MFQAAVTDNGGAPAPAERGWLDGLTACVLPTDTGDEVQGDSLSPCGCDSTSAPDDAPSAQPPPPATAAPGSARVVVLGGDGCGKLSLIRAWRRRDPSTSYESSRHGARFTHVALGNDGHVVLNALDSGDLASPKSMKAAAQTFDEATAREVRVASAHARLSSAEGVAVVVDVAAVLKHVSGPGGAAVVQVYAAGRLRAFEKVFVEKASWTSEPVVVAPGSA